MPMKKCLIAISALACFALGAIAAQFPINGGVGLPDNGPCTPKTGEVGFCNDSGIPTVYDDFGNLYHLPVPGQAATIQIGSVVAGSPANVVNVGSPNAAMLNFTLPPGPQGNPGVIVGNTVSGTLICDADKGQTIASGYTTPCSFKISAIQ